MRALALFLLFVLPVTQAHADPGYAGLDGDPDAPVRSLHDAEPTPQGFTRLPAPDGSLAAWLRALPVRTDRAAVYTYDGRALDAPSAHVVAMDVGSRDLQQCADSAIRLLSEYAWASGRADELGWSFTSGDRTRWADWLDGERFTIGRTVQRGQGAPRANTHRTFRSWLELVFTYAGTRSLALEGEAVGARPIVAGDVFVSAGSPGHAVLVLDVAEHPDGRRAALLGQGFMPAQEFHVLRSRRAASPVIDGVWFVLPTEGELLDTPSWAPFAAADARRMASPKEPVSAP